MVLLLATGCAAQTPGSFSWERSNKTDALRGTAYSQFTLTGKFLTPPKHEALPPELVLKCLSGEHSHGWHQHENGKLLDAFVTIGAVVDSRAGGILIRYRLNDGKIHQDLWQPGTGGTAIFGSTTQISTLLYGHFMPHKEETGDPIHKIVIAVDEYLGAEIVMQFDVPDPTIPADTCGIILHKK
jgi:hypothetical protein